MLLSFLPKPQFMLSKRFTLSFSISFHITFSTQRDICTYPTELEHYQCTVAHSSPPLCLLCSFLNPVHFDSITLLRLSIVLPAPTKMNQPKDFSQSSSYYTLCNVYLSLPNLPYGLTSFIIIHYSLSSATFQAVHFCLLPDSFLLIWPHVIIMS